MMWLLHSSGSRCTVTSGLRCQLPFLQLIYEQSAWSEPLLVEWSPFQCWHDELQLGSEPKTYSLVYKILIENEQSIFQQQCEFAFIVTPLLRKSHLFLLLVFHGYSRTLWEISDGPEKGRLRIKQQPIMVF